LQIIISYISFFAKSAKEQPVMPAEESPSARISPIAIKPEMKIKTLSDQDVEQIHQATLTVLNETGVRFPCRKALQIFAAAGARVDFKSQTVRIQPDLLMQNLAHAPRHFTMGSRGDQTLDVVLDGRKTYCGTAGTGTQTIDPATGQRRPSTKSDIAMMALISDYLPSVSFYWPMVAARDCPVVSIALHELEASFANTQKHVQIVSCVNKQSATSAVEMAQTVAGSRAQLKTRPPLSLIASPISPLGHDQGVVDAALVFAEAGLPVGFASMPVLGSTAPPSTRASLP
jgi:trimethylamine--corrinoid protein Co-methyltransferase